MTPFKKLFSSILLVLTSFVSFGQGEVVSYSYSGATEDSSYYDYYDVGQFSSFEYPSCKGFSLSVVFAENEDYRLGEYPGHKFNYSYDSTSMTMNINVEPNFDSSHDESNIRIEILKFYFDPNQGDTVITVFLAAGEAKATAKADSLWFFDNGSIYRGDTLRSCDLIGDGFQFGTKINDENYSGSIYDNLFMKSLGSSPAYWNRYDYLFDEFEVLINGRDNIGGVTNAFIFHSATWGDPDSSYFSQVDIKTGDTIEIRTLSPFRGRDIVSDNYCILDLPIGSTTGKKILKIVPDEKVDLIDTLVSHEICEGEELQFVPNSLSLVDSHLWEYWPYGWYKQDTLTVRRPYTWKYYNLNASPSSNFCFFDEVSVVTGNNCKGKISGRVYEGTYSNGIEGVLVQTNTGEVGISDSLGNYTIFFDKSNSPKHVFISDPNYMLDSNPLNFVSNTFLLAENENLKTYRLIENDLKITMQSGRNRPGFTIPQYITIHNISKTDITTDVRVNIDPQLTYVETTSGGDPTSVSGNTITWENITVPSGETRRYTYTAELDRLTELGSELNNTAFLFNNSPDNNLLNDTVHYIPVVTGSYDPNDKNAVYFGPSNGNYIHDSTNFEYKIRFQNTGTDTAFTVVVKDKITSKLDLTTFQMVDASHDYSVSIVEDTLVWTFNNILLVDSNTNEPGSHGFIRFHIDQAEGNVNFDEIKNKAFIFFDYNDPIITNEFTSIVHDDLMLSAIEINHNVKVYPNPTSGIVNIEGINSGTLSISNMIGERVLFQDASVDDFGNINLENLPAGLYMLTISSENKISTIKVVKK